MADRDISQLPAAAGVNDADLFVKWDATQTSGQRTQNVTFGQLAAVIVGRIPAGPAGAMGPATTLTVASVATLPPGSPATVTMGGAAPSQNLTFGIPQGPKGDKGDAGGAGPQGGTGAKGDPGATGPAGAAGAAGPKGDKGDVGPKGDRGITGAPGPQGDQGPVGPTGSAGSTGPQGAQGPQGKQGEKGLDGTGSGTANPTGPFTAGNFLVASTASGTPYQDGGTPGSAAFKAVGFFLQSASNLSDLGSAATARGNLGLGTAATQATGTFLQAANNLSDLASASAARGNLGLGSAATQAAASFAQTANNLSDLASASTARTNLGLGTAATQSSAAFLQSANNLSDLSAPATARGNLGLAAVAASGSASDLGTGTLPPARLPNPAATTPGGVRSLAASSNLFLTSIGTDGLPVAAQPSFANLSGSATAAQMPAFTGDVTTAAGSTTTTIAAGAVTNAKLAAAPAGTIKANTTGSAASPSDATPSAVLDAAFGTTQGTVLVRGASAWAAVGPGTSGQVLTSAGAGANPSFAALTASSFPVTGVSAKSANYTIGSTAGDLGKLFDVTGSIALTLPAASGGSAASPLYYHFRKQDGSGRAMVVPNGTDTIEGVNAPAAIYQERGTIVSFGAGWLFPPGGRERTVYVVPPNTAFSGVSALALLTGFDADVAEVDISVDGLTAAGTPSGILSQLYQNGAYTSSNNSYVGTDGTYTTGQIHIPFTLIQVPPASYGALTTTIKNPSSAAARGASVENRCAILGTTSGASVSSVLRGFSPAAFPVAGFRIYPASGTITGTYSQRITRR